MLRVIEVEGAVNFRDFGGYRTATGGRVTSGRLFRCGQMADLTGAGRQHIIDLGVETICDLRFPEERDGDPTPFPMQLPRRMEVPMDPGSAVALRGALGNTELTPEDRRRFMREIYRELAVEHVDAYRRVFDALLETANGGFLVHCTAGKDRTGLAAAFIQRVLGVSEADATDDYLLTNETIDFEGFILPRWRANNPQVTLADVKALSGVEPSYLQTAFTAIDEEFGSFAGFVSDGLRLTTDQRRLLNDRYLD